MLKEKLPKNVVVIGAGVTGLTTAYMLQQRGHHVYILEKNTTPGGAIQSIRRDGFLVEAGPNTMLLNDPAVLEFFRSIGIAEEMVNASAEANKRYIVRGGRPLAVPMGPGELIKTPFLSGRAKWRLLAEPFIRRAHPDREESVAEFARRRLGQEIVDYAVNPLIGGIYAGDPEKLSVRHAFPKLHQFDRDHGSLALGAIAAARSRKRSGQPRFKTRSISFSNGLHTIIDALVHAAGDNLYTGVSIDSIQPGAPWRILISRNGHSTEIKADAVVVTTPAHATATLPFAGVNPLAELAGITYPPVTSVSLGFQRDHVAHPLDGYGVLVPAREGRRILGTLFNSSLFPGRAPKGCVLLTTFIGGMRQPEIATRPERELRELVVEELQALLGVAAEPFFCHVTSWPRAIPQYTLGYDRFHQVMDAAEKAHPGLIVGGHVRDGVSVGDCIRAGWKLAGRLE